MKELTIAVPIYNIEEYLPRCLESISKCNAANDIEVLMVDDGSTDSCPLICQDYANQHPSVFFHLRKENGHYGSAVNHAIEHANGLFFKIIDGDDEICPSALDELVSIIKENKGIDLILTDFTTVFDGENKTKHRHFDMPALQAIPFKHTDIDAPEMHTMTIKTSILKDNGIQLDTGVPFTDVEFLLYPLPFVTTAYYLPKTVYLYHMGRDGQSADPKQFAATMPAHELVLNNVIAWFEALDQSCLTAQEMQRILNRVAGMGIEHIDRCLIAGSSIDVINSAKRVMKRISANPDLEHSVKKARKAALLDVTHFLAYRPLSFMMQKRGR